MFFFVSPITLSPCRLSGRGVQSARGRELYRTTRRKRSTVCASQSGSTSSSQASSSGESARDENDGSMRWQEELRMLLDPTLNSSARQVLLQDLAKQFPKVVEDVLQSPCVSRQVRGVSDVLRQLTDDVLPDLMNNGPNYVSRAMENATSRSSSSSSSSGTSFTPPSLNVDDVRREFRNVFNRTPEGLYTPEYRVLLSGEGYQIRQYPTLIIAETSMRPEQENSRPMTEVDSATVMGRSFSNLAGYLFGKNRSNKEMKMTTPVILQKGVPQQETMSFIIGEYQSLNDVPKTMDESVNLREEPGKIYAVCEFSGYVTQGEARRQRNKLMSLLLRDNIQVTEQGRESYKCMIYNGPSTLPNLRRNELMIEVEYSET